MVHAALDVGINFFDTANVYGATPTSTGQALHQPRNASPRSRSSAAPSPADATTWWSRPSAGTSVRPGRRPVAPVRHRPGRPEPAPPRHRLHRRLLCAFSGPRHPAGADPGGVRRSTSRTARSSKPGASGRCDLKSTAVQPCRDRGGVASWTPRWSGVGGGPGVRNELRDVWIFGEVQDFVFPRAHQQQRKRQRALLPAVHRFTYRPSCGARSSRPSYDDDRHQQECANGVVVDTTAVSADFRAAGNRLRGNPR